jgi:hypothetical protein
MGNSVDNLTRREAIERSGGHFRVSLLCCAVEDLSQTRLQGQIATLLWGGGGTAQEQKCPKRPAHSTG